jgi:catechol 2,3-dioxygenase-like lactoylglutathione lyase family enzyme
MLHDKPLVAFIATADAGRAKKFYTDVLGLLLVREDDHALVYEAEGTTLRIQKVRDFTPQPFTALGWEVRDIETTMRALGLNGVRFERFGLPGQDDAGIWTAPSGTRVAWFKDPDGNVLSLSSPA